ncbi:MAG: M1 family metallopeptidase, partial [Candidatus Binatia bacterium]
MKLNKSRGLILITAAILALNLVAGAQDRRPNFDRPRTYDVQNYIIRVSFDRAAKTVFGDTTVELKPLGLGFREVELDAVNMAFDSVKLDPAGTDLKYKTESSKIVVTLDRAYGPDETISVRFKYSARPKKGIYFQDAIKDQGGDFDAQIWTQGETEEARYWFPSFDFPSDKATAEEYITAEKGLTVVGNGEHLPDIENADGTVTSHFRMAVPYSTYLTSFVIGKYTRVDDKYGDIPLGFYVYPGKEAIAPLAFAKTKIMMQAFEELTGVKFPYNKYDQTIVRNFQFGGMENITATTHADTEVFMANYGFGVATVEDLVSHELSHSWFGDLVTCNNWAELWLNESFADFMESAWRERAYGRGSYINKLRSDAEQAIADDAANPHRHGLYNVLAKPDDSIFDTTTYQKGGTVVHMLREQVGNEVFWKAINVYLNAHKFANVTT